MQEVKHNFILWSSSSTPRNIPGEVTGVWVFIVVLYIIAKDKTNPFQCLTDKWIIKIHPKECE